MRQLIPILDFSILSSVSYNMDQVTGGKLEESKKNAVIREGKGGIQPTSGGNAKKRLKPKKLVGKLHDGGAQGVGDAPGQGMSLTGQQQQTFQFQNNAHLSIHGHLPGAGQAVQGGVSLPMVAKNAASGGGLSNH